MEGCLKKEEFFFAQGVCFEVFDEFVRDEGEDEAVEIMLLLPGDGRDREGFL